MSVPTDRPRGSVVDVRIDTVTPDATLGTVVEASSTPLPVLAS